MGCIGLHSRRCCKVLVSPAGVSARLHAPNSPSALCAAAPCRFHPEVLDALCFPSGLSAHKAAVECAAAGDAADSAAKGGGKGAKQEAAAFSALDGLWQLLKEAPVLLQAQPKLLAAVLRLLAVLWECQGSAHGAVELLRCQPGFWAALKVRDSACFRG